ncbi:FIGNL1-interacting regulator of recombination and mitosis isoform X2 [Osmerus mordax]|uniref:FIGNL1-interacting regulator of recombination and mitosis isoform X2 n=1 Tax=Osmerus mordax TaxID=8014 RepID=UPI00350F374F
MFLPHIDLSELEDECFSKLLPKVVKVFDGLMEEIANQVGGLSSQNTGLQLLLRNALQETVQVLGVLSACVRHVCSSAEAPALNAIRSLPFCVLKVLTDTFQHCKDSEVVYCGRLSLVADLLQALFKEAYSLQKGLMELLDRVSVETSASEEVSDIVTVIHNLMDICSVISNLDIALHANTWKCIIKQSVKHQSLVEDRLRHGDISSRLCDDLLASLHSCLELGEQIRQAGPQVTSQSPEYKLFQKNTKMCRFFANTLIHYIKEFKSFLTKFCGRFHQLYLSVLSKFPPSLCAPALPPPLSEELAVAVVVPMDALLLQLLPIRGYAEAVLQPDQQLTAEAELPQCVLLVNVLSHLPSQPEEALQLWYSGSQFPEDTPRLPLFLAVFQSFQRCSTERRVPVLLPGVMLKGQAQGRVTLHQHVCVHLCACVAALPPAHFHLLERCLLATVLQTDTQTALLAVDVWCFLARYGTAEMCLHHVLLLADLVRLCPGEGHHMAHLGLLLRRMVFLMTASHQLELVQRHPASCPENQPVWRHVLLRALSPEARQRAEEGLLALVLSALAGWQQGGHRLAELGTVNEALPALLALVRCDSAGAESVSSALTVVTQLWARMCPSQVHLHPVIQRTLRLLLSTSAILVKNIDPEVVCQALGCVGALVSQTCPDDVALAALDFLASLGMVFFPADVQSQVLPRVSGVFGALLAEGSWLLQHHALEAFAHFAEMTNHEEVISRSLNTEETKTKVVNFLSKTITTEEAGETRLWRLRGEAAAVEQHRQRLDSPEEVAAETSPAAPEPCPKRARLEPSAEQEYERHVQAAEASLRALLALAHGGDGTSVSILPPPWLSHRLQELQTLITRISMTHTPDS